MNRGEYTLWWFSAFSLLLNVLTWEKLGSNLRDHRKNVFEKTTFSEQVKLLI